MNKRRFYGKRYKSGDNQIDWIFRKLIQILYNKVEQIVFINPLRNPDNPRHFLWGLWNEAEHIVEFGNKKIVYEKKTIYIDPEKHRKTNEDMLWTLVHELSHILFPHTSERDIQEEEDILSKRLSENQKRALRTFLPK